MKPVMTEKKDIKIIGIEVRTSNHAEMSGAGKIGAHWQKFFQENVAGQITNSVSDDIFAIYMDYESDVNGEYSFVLGKQVDSFTVVPAGLVAKVLPASKYSVFTTPKGPMPNVVIEAWQHIWSLSAAQLGAERAYRADFEVYDHRSADPGNTQIEIFISVK